MFGLRLFEWLDIIELGALIFGGAWALYIYWTARRDQVKVGIEVQTRLKKSFAPNKCLLIATLKISNTSDVLWRYERSFVRLYDARKLASNGALRLVPFAERDAFRAVYGEESDEVEVISRGETFSYFEGQEISLEPGEQVISEVGFPVDQDKLGLMALKVWISGRQRNTGGQPYEWATFLFVDPGGDGNPRAKGTVSTIRMEET